MSLTARDVMQRDVRTARPDWSFTELERALVAERVSGFPVVEDGELVGVVSRSDVVRMLCVERSGAEQLSDYYCDLSGFAQEPPETIGQIAVRVNARIETLRVSDAMCRGLVTVAPEATLAEVAQTLVDRHIHRVPVTDGKHLVGIVSSLDLVRLLAEGRATLS